MSIFHECFEPVATSGSDVAPLVLNLTLIGAPVLCTVAVDKNKMIELSIATTASVVNVEKSEFEFL